MADRGKMISVLGKMIVEARTDATVLSIIGSPAMVTGADAPDDATGRPFVLLRRLGPIRRFPRAPMMTGRISVDCYGRTPAEATNLYNAVSNVFSARGPRKSAGGVALYLTIEEVGGMAGLDPDTDQPVERSIYSYSAPLAQASS